MNKEVEHLKYEERLREMGLLILEKSSPKGMVQHLALGLVKSHEIPMGPLLELVQVPLNDILSFRCVSCTIQLDAICRFVEGALDPSALVTNEDVKKCQSQYQLLQTSLVTDVQWDSEPLTTTL
ncbi:hypothetical protein HGM15179_017476 [Zosterops borbonicus]|uniref:Uncharacterized protein n=1 Tax=Zosterops borbonicus TaxID=364589 RepID=A0A8K1G0S2_9PASS|nr:hypothetical protein HGM15179_017476 [Zosterops borbonicus]